MSKPARLRRNERGVTIVEAAFVIPLVFMFALGLIDVGLWVFQTGQAASAARDGARVGILKYKTAESGADFNRIETEVNRRLAGQGGVSVTVSCRNPDGSAATKPDGTSATCNTIDLTKKTYKIRVAVTWQRPALTPLSSGFGNTSVNATASMTIVGLPSPA